MNFSFYTLWASYFISKIGDWLFLIALPLIVYDLTGSAFYMATLYGVEFLPWLLFSLFGGILADNLNKKFLLITGNTLSAGFVLFLIYLLKAPELNIPLLYVAVFLLASINPLIHPAFQSIVPLVVKREKIVNANSALQLVENSLNLIGPVLGGGIVAFLGGTNALLIDASSFAIAALLMVFVRLLVPDSSQTNQSEIVWTKRIGRDIVEGFKYTGTNKVILFGAMLFFFTNLGIHLFQSNFMFYLKDTLELSANLIGITIGLSGIGPILGAFAAPYINKKMNSGRIILWCTTLAGASMYLLIISETFWQVAVSQSLIMFFGNINVITYFSLRQQIVPSHILGRVISVTRMISYASIPLGAFLGGYAIKLGLSIYLIILIGATIRMGIGLIGFLTPLGSKDTINNAKETIEAIN
ncbi:MFS transporter [Bacillus sp. Marseille-Q3570]|uniref:MFS transporter n=1 Tax=Bacillus sp. Marseille-Q3570 TaxID=2963522 RepID=UPI0021B74AC5|nr:MFS transporter [Bacillus sp. Marseille-Q3570]